MDKKFLVQLTSNFYQLTLLFPKKEPLRLKMRELSLEILADAVKLESSNPSTKIIPEILKDIEILDSFFEVAKNQNWVGPAEILNLKLEYSTLREELEKLKEKERLEQRGPILLPAGLKETKITKIRPVYKNSTRQQKILEVLKQKGRTQVKDLKEIFPEMSKRTLRRDFERLFKQGLVERIGEKQDTFYELKGAESELIGQI